MRQLKLLLLATLLLTFVGGVGTGAWIGSLVAGPDHTALDSVDRRVGEFAEFFDLDATQVRRIRTVLLVHEKQKAEIRQLTPEQFQRIRRLEEKTRDEIRTVLDEQQRIKYDNRSGRG